MTTTDQLAAALREKLPFLFGHIHFSDLWYQHSARELAEHQTKTIPGLRIEEPAKEISVLEPFTTNRPDGPDWPYQF